MVKRNGLQYWNRMFPCQPPLRKYFSGDPDTLYRKLYRFIERHSSWGKTASAFSIENETSFSNEEMGISPVQRDFLCLLLQMSGARRALEIGTFVGASALAIAAALPEGGSLITIEKSEKFAAIASANFKKNGMEEKIIPLIGDALSIIKGMTDEVFDFVFLDGDKEHYREYLKAIKPLLRPKGGLLVVDDIFFNGDMLNDIQKTSKGRGIKDFLDEIRDDPTCTKHIFPIDNGMLILRKL